jgi:CDP-Glycerol:Poly(glycerophosphate) glycerophosphotransferase
VRSARDAGRNLGLTLVQGTLRTMLRLLSLAFPQTRSVVVSAFPETEGNGLEVARALVRRYDGRVVWLREGNEPPAEVRALADEGMVLVDKASLRGLLQYLRAEAVFFTHGLYGSPRPCRRKPIVNIWHGDGPKDVAPDNGTGDLIPSTYLVGSTRLFSGHQAAALQVPADRVLVTGNPRTDQFWPLLDPARLEPLGITGNFVVWMPTFRRTRAVGAVRRWSETDDTDARDGRRELSSLLGQLRERGIQLVIKPHSMDADRRQWDGAITVSEEDLVRAGVSLYALLGQSRGLVTDYSSVWVDYLLLDRPLAFLVPDRESYGRKLIPADVLDWVPGELVDHHHKPFREFLADVDANGRVGCTVRAEVATRIGLNTSRKAADDLITALEERGVIATRRTVSVSA